MKIEVERSDLEKIYDVLEVAAKHHIARDEMNGHLHLAKNVIQSPLTSELFSSQRRLLTILGRE